MSSIIIRINLNQHQKPQLDEKHEQIINLLPAYRQASLSELLHLDQVPSKVEINTTGYDYWDVANGKDCLVGDIILKLNLIIFVLWEQ